ncbi:TVP38/TMEM64 family protein [Leptothermofonsia sp. ETS-13]|uniref:TVP38/TMEM64 family protein n=1 Tax=Leptothermofonsia sp. ETS-13 TaxID=3035696 RepID=UPI003BA2D864
MIASGVAILAIALKQLNVQDYLQSVLLWIQNLGPAGAIAFMAIYILATVLFIPGSLLTLGGGAIFGVLLGSVYVFLAASIGATLAFLIGRYLARGWVSKQIEGNTKFKAVDNAIAREGLKIVILTRLSPVFPFNLLNYALGVTQVSLKDYLVGFIGMLPGTVMYVYIGSLAGSLAMIGSPSTANPQTQMIQWIIRIVGLIATIAVTVYVTRIARKALDESVANEPVNNAPIREGE